MKKIVVLSTFLFFTGILFAQNVNTGGKETLKIKGFVSTTFFGQNQGFVFGNGQNAEFAAPPEYTHQPVVLRRRRTQQPAYNGIQWSRKLQMTGNWAGYLSLTHSEDLTARGHFSAEQPTPRLRLAYLDIVHDNLTIRLGTGMDTFIR